MQRALNWTLNLIIQSIRMSNLTLHIRLGDLTKRISCKNNITVNQLIDISLERFGKQALNGELTHGGKVLERSLPLRLTTLINNSKVELSITKDELVQDINIKTFISRKEGVRSCVKTFANSISIEDLLREIESTEQIPIFDDEFEVTVLNTKIRSNEKDMTKSVKQIVGGAKSLVLRVGYITSTSVKKEQDRINKDHITSMSKFQAQELARQKLAKTHTNKLEDKIPKNERDIGHAVSQSSEVSLKEVDTEPLPLEIVTAEEEYRTEEKKDMLYIPSEVERYENPEEDYQMTIDQAKKYHQMVVNSGKRVQHKEKKQPKEYSIRIRFPDRKFLQIYLEDSNIKFGQFLKKLDLYLLPQYVSQFILKLGHPPFSILECSFKNNDKPLNQLPQFQDEKILLIWEPLTHILEGPFIKQNSIEADSVREINDLPEMQVENTRITSNEEPESTLVSLPKESKKNSKVPGWLKLSKS